MDAIDKERKVCSAKCAREIEMDENEITPQTVL